MLTTRQVAAALDVSESSVKRWCDEGRLDTVRTPGGHRRISAAAVLRWSRGGGPPVVRPAALAQRGAASSRLEPADNRRAFLRALLRDDADSALACLRQRQMTTSGFDEVADALIAPVLHDIGDRWARGAVEVYEERRACNLVHRCLDALASGLPALDRGARRAIGGTLEGDPFTVPTALVELVLRERGMAARSLGSWLPAATIARAVRDERPHVVWLSMSHAPRPLRLVEDVGLIERAARAVGARLVVGGRALDAPLRRRLRYTAFCDGMVQLAAFAETMR